MLGILFFDNMDSEGDIIMDQFSLQGKTAFLSGAGGFFGGYFANALANARVQKLILVDRNENRLRKLAGEIKEVAKNTTVITRGLDLYDRNTAEVVLRQYAQDGVDIVVNNAFDFSSRTGFNVPEGRLESATFDQLEACFESGLWWAIQATQILGGVMASNGGGSIINIASMYGVVVPHSGLYVGTTKFNPPGYSMAKAGLIQFTKYAASFLGPRVRVNALSPGAIPNIESVTKNSVDTQHETEFIQRLVARTLLGRVGHPRDLTGPLIFLASDASSYMTGHNLVVDGGWTVV